MGWGVWPVTYTCPCITCMADDDMDGDVALTVRTVDDDAVARVLDLGESSSSSDDE